MPPLIKGPQLWFQLVSVLISLVYNLAVFIALVYLCLFKIRTHHPTQVPGCSLVLRVPPIRFQNQYPPACTGSVLSLSATTDGSFTFTRFPVLMRFVTMR